jgi:hypothetical protein
MTITARTCLICGKEFRSHLPLKLTCSAEHSDQLREQRRRERYARGKGRTADVEHNQGS